MVDWEKEFPQPPAAPPRWREAAPAIRFADDAPVLIDLLHPLLIGEGEAAERLERLSIRRITAGEMIRIVEGPEAPGDDATLIRHVVAAMAGISLDVLDGLSPDDAGRLAAAALPFMPAGLVAAIEARDVAAPTEVAAAA